jgi:hygromycin-B 7''-O-kinase
VRRLITRLGRQDQRTRRELAFGSLPEYLRSLDREDVWLPVAEAIRRRERLAPGDTPVLASTGYAPTILLPPDHVVKVYGPWRGRRMAFATERRALRILARAPELPMPRFVAAGRLDPYWRYIVMTRIPGTSLAEVRGTLAPDAMRGVARWVGGFVGRLHAIPLEPQEQRAGGKAFERRFQWLYRTAVQEHAARLRLPPHLLSQLKAWLPSDSQLLDAGGPGTFLHGDLSYEHVVGEVRAGRFEPTGVIDLGKSSVGPRMFDLPLMWIALAGEDMASRQEFLAAAGLPSLDDPEFLRQLLAWALVRTARRGSVWRTLGGLESVASLDELALRWSRPATSIPGSTAGPGVPVPDGLRGRNAGMDV